MQTIRFFLGSLKSADVYFRRLAIFSTGDISRWWIAFNLSVFFFEFVLVISC